MIRSIEFVTTPDETGKGRVIVDGRYYGLPLGVVLEYKALRDILDTNIQLLRATCNTSKGAKDPIEFMQSRGFLL